MFKCFHIPGSEDQGIKDPDRRPDACSPCTRIGKVELGMIAAQALALSNSDTKFGKIKAGSHTCRLRTKLKSFRYFSLIFVIVPPVFLRHSH